MMKVQRRHRSKEQNAEPGNKTTQISLSNPQQRHEDNSIQEGQSFNRRYKKISMSIHKKMKVDKDLTPSTNSN